MSDSFSSPDKEKVIEVDIGSAERASSNDSYTPLPDSRLHRELKNRHVAMIRYSSVNLSDCIERPSPATFQHWWCDWHRTIPRNWISTHEWRSSRPLIRLHVYWVYMLLCDGQSSV
jgi:hypothetical protein